MPHLQEKNDCERSSQHMKGNSSMQESEDLPIMAATRKQSLAVKTESYDSADDDSSSSKKEVITPSPFGAALVHSPKSSRKQQGPMLSIYGSTRLFPSPIRVKKRVSVDEVDKEAEDVSIIERLGQPKILRYGRKLPMAQSLSFEKLNKRQLEQKLEEKLSPNKKPKSADTPENKKLEGDAALFVPRKKPIISPASSGEKLEDDESTGTISRGNSHPLHGRQPYPPPYHHQYLPIPPPHSYALYGPGYPSMYRAYPLPASPAHYMGSPPPPGAYPSPYYASYPPHHHSMTPSYRPQPSASPHRRLPMEYPMGMHPMNAKGGKSSTPEQSPKNISRTPSSGEGKECSIKSVAEWQRAAVSNGRPPSTNQCVPLTEPIPSKCWGESDKNKDIRLPEFHRLVNYPDYLTKSRTSSSSSDANSPSDGKKHCVMCGKLRFCSVSSLVNKSRSTKQEEQEDDYSAAHIIPRQNKGLCTACDVTVWVVQANDLEIKWCKGCKNFRSWASFGDKGSATKCVRCRDRQREKYAMQKDAIRLRRYKETTTGKSPSSGPEKKGTVRNWEDKNAEEIHLAAANGLRNLIHAATN